MTKYLHIFRFHEEDKSLFELEMKYVFKRKDLNKRYFLDNSLNCIEGSSFGLTVLEIHCQGADLHELKEAAAELPVLHDAKLDDLSIGFLPRASFNDVKKILPALKIHANLVNPQNCWYLTRTENCWYLGREVSNSVKKWARHRSKPETMSSAIPHILAHTITYILWKTGHKSLIDYCCGSGTFLLEAASLGMKCTGVDKNQNMIDMSAKNLAHFEYEAQLFASNAANFTHKADCGTVDFPYGLHCRRDEKQEQAIIKNVMNHVKTAVFITGSNLEKFLNSEDWIIKEYFTVPAVNIIRHVYFVTHDRN